MSEPMWEAMNAPDVTNDPFYAVEPVNSYDEHLISQAGGDGEPAHATFCNGQHVMGESPCVVAPAPGPRVSVKITIYPAVDVVGTVVRFTNVPLSIVEEAIAHINDNADTIKP